MTERVRRRTSKWDLKEDPVSFPSDTTQPHAVFGKAGESIYDNGSIQEWDSSKNTGSCDPQRPDAYSSQPFMSEGKSRWSNRAEYKDDNASRDLNEARNLKVWDENRSYSRSMSPGADGWRPQSCSRSPKRGWSRSHRSRSPPRRLRSRSRSRSPPHGLRSRSRSRSPSHGLKRDSGGWNDRIRGGARVTVCNDFQKGRCRRGSQCRFLHQENNEYEDRRHSGSAPADEWGSRDERGGSYGSSKNVEREISRDKLIHGHDSQRNDRYSNRCINFLKGNCHRGSSCRFIHESSIADGRETSGRYDHRREPYRNNTLCKYFAAGNCRKGMSCRFSHEAAAHDRLEERSVDNWKGKKMGDENESWVGPKWSEEAVDSTHGSAEGRLLNYGSSRSGNSTWDGPGWTTKPSSWNDDEAAAGRAKAVSGDEKWGQNLVNKNNSWGGPKWGDEAAGRPEARSADDKWGHNLVNKNNSWGGPKWGDEAAGRQEVSSADDKWGLNIGGENKSWAGPGWGGEAAGPANGSVEGRSMNDGRGRMENSGSEGPKWGDEAAGRPEVKSADESWAHNLDDQNKSWAGSKWGDEVAGPANGGVGAADGSVQGLTVNDGREGIVNSRSTDSRLTKQPIGPSWNNKAADSEVKNIPRWGNADNAGHVGINEENKVVGATKWSDNATESEVTKMDERNDADTKNGIPVQRSTQRSLDDGTHYNANDQNSTWGVPKWGDKPSDQEVHKSPRWINDNNSASMGVQLPRDHEEMLTFSTSSDCVERNQSSHLIDNGKTRFSFQEPQFQFQGVIPSHEQASTREVSGHQHHSTVATYPEGERHIASGIMMHPEASNMNAQSQQMLVSPSPRVRSFDLNGPVEEVPSPNHQRLLHMGETSKEAGIIEPRMSPITSGAPVTQNIVTSEEVAHISQISASLAQILAKGQQLPQLYATLNSTNPIGLVSSSPNSASLASSVGGSYQSDQNTWSQRQCYPVSSSMESSQVNIHPPGSGKPFTQGNMTDHESHKPLQPSVPSSVPSEPNGSGSDPAKKGSMERRPHHPSNAFKQSESVGNEKASDSVVKEQVTANSGDTNADGRMDEDSKKNKDTKGMRMFKFALVEFVKEILKPTWKEGQLSKEAHKTVVKKVVDKVTGSVQGEHIPQTQEKIDQYLVYSKTKLTKLVEAYVEKYVKPTL